MKGPRGGAERGSMLSGAHAVWPVQPASTHGTQMPFISDFLRTVRDLSPCPGIGKANSDRGVRSSPQRTLGLIFLLSSEVLFHPGFELSGLPSSGKIIGWDESGSRCFLTGGVGGWDNQSLSAADLMSKRLVTQTQSTGGAV